MRGCLFLSAITSGRPHASPQSSTGRTCCSSWTIGETAPLPTMSVFWRRSHACPWMLGASLKHQSSSSFASRTGCLGTTGLNWKRRRPTSAQRQMAKKQPRRRPPDGRNKANMLQAMLQAMRRAQLKQCQKHALHSHSHIHRKNTKNILAARRRRDSPIRPRMTSSPGQESTARTDFR